MKLSVFHTRSTFKGYVFSRTSPCPHDQEIFLGWCDFDAGHTAGTCSSRSRDYKAKTNPQMKYNRNCKTNQIQIQNVSAMGRVSVGVHCSGRAWFSLQPLPTEGPLTTSSSVARPSSRRRLNLVHTARHPSLWPSPGTKELISILIPSLFLLSHCN